VKKQTKKKYGVKGCEPIRVTELPASAINAEAASFLEKQEQPCFQVTK